MPKIVYTKRDRYMEQQLQLCYLLFFIYPAADKITVAVNHRGYTAKGIDNQGKTVFHRRERRPDPEKYIENPFLLFDLSPEQLGSFTPADIDGMLKGSDLFAAITAGEIALVCGAHVVSYAHRLDILWKQAVDYFWDLCRAHRGEAPSSPYYIRLGHPVGRVVSL